MATETKPTLKYDYRHWYTQNNVTSRDSEQARNHTDQVIEDSRSLRIFTDNQVKWDQLETNNRLADRIQAIRKMQEMLDIAKTNLDKEIRVLSDAKTKTENFLEQLTNNIDVNNECLTLRDGRGGSDYVRDDAEKQLKQEQELLTNVKQQLQKQIDEAFEALCHMQDARKAFDSDMNNKATASEIDITQYNMNEKSPYISYKPYPTRKPDSETSPDQWEAHSLAIIDQAQRATALGQRLAGDLHCGLHRAQNAIEHQMGLTDEDMRKRIHEDERALGELEWQKKNTDKKRAELLKEIRALEEAHRAKIPSLKLAETRLENRQDRAEWDHCRDASEESLMFEVGQIPQAVTALQQQLARARDALHQLDQDVHQLNTEMATKRRSLNIDREVTNTRQRLQRSPSTATPCSMIPRGVVRQKLTY